LCRFVPLFGRIAGLESPANWQAGKPALRSERPIGFRHLLSLSVDTGPGGKMPALYGRRDARRHGSVGFRQFRPVACFINLC